MLPDQATIHSKILILFPALFILLHSTGYLWLCKDDDAMIAAASKNRRGGAGSTDDLTRGINLWREKLTLHVA